METTLLLGLSDSLEAESLDILPRSAANNNSKCSKSPSIALGRKGIINARWTPFCNVQLLY